MTQATLSNFFGGNSEEVGLEPVVLYDGVRITNGQDVPLSEDMSNFECIEIHSSFTSSGNKYELEPRIVTPTTLLDTSYSSVLISQRYSSEASRADVLIIQPASTTTSLRVSAISSTNWTAAGIHKVIGYRRRISTVGLDEILSVVAQPNLLLNTWLAGALVVNQRAFDGNWAALAIGAYGYDMWFKYSATHMAQIVEAGTYKPGTKHILQANGGVVGEFVTPADGDHFLVAVPFAWDKFDLRRSIVKVPWHPETQARLDECYKSFYKSSSQHVGGVIANGAYHIYISVRFPVIMRDTPSVSATTINAPSGSSSSTNESIMADGFYRDYGGSATGNVVATFVYTADATLKLSDVTDDTEHRVVWS